MVSPEAEALHAQCVNGEITSEKGILGVNKLYKKEPLETADEYRVALKEIEGLMAAKMDTPEGDRLDILAALVGAYESKHFPMGLPDLEKLTLFLDFDGVLHPFLARSGADAFCYLPRLENVLREFPAVQIVIASTQREIVPLELLVQRFSPDIAARIVGVTPILEIHDASDVAGSRHREILAYLDGSGACWFALDDDASLFPPGCAELVLCDDGFQDAGERALRVALSRFAYADSPVLMQAIRTRCDELGLSLACAQRLAAVAQTGYSDSQALLWVLGLDFVNMMPLKPRRWLWMAAQTANVSYRGTLTSDVLLAILTTGVVPVAFVAHVVHLLEEAPVQLVVMAVEQAAQQSGVLIAAIWGNVELIAGRWSRRAWDTNNKEHSE